MAHRLTHPLHGGPERVSDESREDKRLAAFYITTAHPQPHPTFFPIDLDEGVSPRQEQAQRSHLAKYVRMQGESTSSKEWME